MTFLSSAALVCGGVGAGFCAATGNLNAALGFVLLFVGGAILAIFEQKP